MGEERSFRGLGVKVRGQRSCHQDTPKGQEVKMTLSLLTRVKVVKDHCYMR